MGLWEMYHTVQVADISRLVDSFVAITFACYEDSNAANVGFIKSTQEIAASCR